MILLSLSDLLMILFFLGFLSLCINRIYLLMILLSLEFIVLVIFITLIVFLNLYEMELFFSLFFLVFSVCEGVLGLSVLIMMVRMHGNDYFQVLTIL